MDAIQAGPAVPTNKRTKILKSDKQNIENQTNKYTDKTTRLKDGQTGKMDKSVQYDTRNYEDEIQGKNVI